MSIFGATGFDATKIEVKEDYAPLPPGNYSVVISATKVKPTRAGNGQYLELEFTVSDANYNGRKVWTNLNLVNPNPTAVKIATEHLASICKAVNVPVIQDEAILVGKALSIKVVVKDDRNEVKAYKAIGTATPAPASAPTIDSTPKSPEPTPTASAEMPWGN